MNGCERKPRKEKKYLSLSCFEIKTILPSVQTISVTLMYAIFNFAPSIFYSSNTNHQIGMGEHYLIVNHFMEKN